VASALLGFGRGERPDEADEEALVEAQERSAQNKADSKLEAQVS
jgi:hypothetical protein